MSPSHRKLWISVLVIVLVGAIGYTLSKKTPPVESTQISNEHGGTEAFTLNEKVLESDNGGYTAHYYGSEEIHGSFKTNMSAGVCFVPNDVSAELLPEVDVANIRARGHQPEFCFNNQEEVLAALKVTKKDISTEESLTGGWEAGKCLEWPATIVINGYRAYKGDKDGIDTSEFVKATAIGDMRQCDKF